MSAVISILGTGGHARSLAAVISRMWLIPEMVESNPSGEVVIGVGDLTERRKLYDEWQPRFIVRDPSAVVMSELGKADQVMAGVIVGPNCQIGVNALLNTRCSIDHDCIIGNNTHIAPGAVLCGHVVVGDGAFIGAGAIVTPGVFISPGAFVKAGILCSRNV